MPSSALERPRKFPARNPAVRNPAVRQPTVPKAATQKPGGRKRQTLAELRALQRLAGSAIMRPLDEDFRMQQTWSDDRDTASVIATFIKPNDRLTSFERLEIYNRQYWFRLIDCMYDDFPGLLAIVGTEAFSRLSRAYIAKYPSRSFSLRNLGSHLIEFLDASPHWAAPNQKMAQDMARFEWAQIVAFDGPGEPPITPADLAGRDPSRLRLRIQPYLAILELAYPLDVFTLALKKKGLRNEASNAIEENRHAAKTRRVSLPRPKTTYIAVHRLDNDLYFKRLDPAAYKLLTALRDGRTLAQACELIAGEATPKKIGAWFANWTTLGWFCKAPSRKTA